MIKTGHSSTIHISLDLCPTSALCLSSYLTRAVRSSRVSGDRNQTNIEDFIRLKIMFEKHFILQRSGRMWNRVPRVWYII